MKSARAQLEEGINALGLQVSAVALERFDTYLRELLRWNERLNITAATGAAEIVGLHFLDSLLPLTVWEFPRNCWVIDVGSGAGFPGIPLKFMRPDLHVSLVEASRGRVAFLERIRGVCNLEDVEVVWARAEALARRPEYREVFFVAVERATARLGAALELCLPLIAVGGAAILLKGPRAMEEMKTATALATALGGWMEPYSVRRLPTADRQRVIVAVRKVRPTPARFPRRIPRIGRPT